jgi:predicted NAD/FAD-binding protein
MRGGELMQSSPDVVDRIGEMKDKPTTTWRSPLSVTRRDVIMRGAAAATLGAGSVLLGRGAAAAASRAGRAGSGRSGRHVAIIGAGAGGVAAAYFLAGTVDVDMFEARSKIGGHCDSHVIDYRGKRVTVDLGAQFFHPDTHPIYVTLLEQLGLYDPAHPDSGDTLEAPASLCIFPAAGGPPTFSSSHPLATVDLALEFAKFLPLARQAVLSDMPWETTVEAWVRRLPVSQPFKSEIVYPWVTALIGCTRGEALTASARSILQTFALEFPANVAQGATTYNSRIGLQGNLQRMLEQSPGVRVHLSAAVHGLRRRGSRWFVDTPSGRHGPYDGVVLNAPPHNSRRIVSGVPELAHVTALLERYEYFDSRIVIHTDPAYVQGDRTNWATYNAEVDGRQCEGSVWYGALQPELPSGHTVDVFKSWAERRRTDPQRIRLERRYKHPHITKSTIRTARALRPLQGRHGLYFSGQYTTGFDSQESAVYSAIKVAESLAPHSTTLTALKKLLRAHGLAGVSYDL